MKEITKHGKIVTIKTGIYTIYVFQLDDGEYLMCTRLPNWGTYYPGIGDSGFITVEEAKAGESYYDRVSGTTKVYQYSNVYFKEFVKDRRELKDIIL